MKANELRIGNLVIIDDKDSIFRVLFIKENVVQILELGKNYPYAVVEIERIKPIPLTEEIILKLGFKENNNKWFEINYFTNCNEYPEKMGILINWVSGRCALLDTDDGQQPVMTAKMIQYLHQLQNLYFALAGEELDITNLLP